MPHPGYEFTRVSSSTVSKAQCPRELYFDQILGLRRVPNACGDTGPFAAGTVFHTMLEVEYQPTATRHLPLMGTDGRPTIPDHAGVIDYCLDNHFAPDAVSQAETAYKQYLEEYDGDDALRACIIGRPETDVHCDMRKLVDANKHATKVEYAAQYDLLIRAPNGGVASVEHKLLGTIDARAVHRYKASGQLVGQCATWNSRPDLVDRFGRMSQVVLNITTKQRPARFHRETLFIPMSAQVDYVKTLRIAVRGIKRRLHDYKYAKDAYHREMAFPKLGQTFGMCVPFAGSPCCYLPICDTGEAHGAVFQIAEPFHQRAVDDGVIRVDPTIETYPILDTLAPVSKIAAPPPPEGAVVVSGGEV